TAPGMRCSATGPSWNRWASARPRSLPWGRLWTRTPCAIPSMISCAVLRGGPLAVKMVDKLSENILDKFSMDFLRNQVLKNAYGNNDTLVAAMDPRILIAWYLFFGLVPWFVNSLPFLLGCFVLVTITTALAHVAGLVLFLFGLGVF